ncbi:HAD family hydrolase [Jannaschia formosa]|uniref:sulfotransferase-like domain-containing protein n=1 Tax=Jannaschia formosa TaxID=2259592 RepID=UPI000E1B9FA2|nr:HAD family hydrolase [Jannaschia formosa]TFL19192.1 HAD family hydrolase [Jannaschia formosa]
MRIAAWSGPRNLSTAMMYSFGNRPDCDVMDEPFYAAFLARTGLPHPMREAVLASQPTEPEAVAALCAQEGNPHVYQKHMAQHMDGMPLGWAEGCAHVHLIRHPARVIASFREKHDALSEEAIAFAGQATLYDRLGGIVVDTEDLRRNPRAMLQKLCAEIGLPWSEAMLSWPAGGHQKDGVWAAHWYGAVHRSTGFAGPEGPMPEVDTPDLLRAALPFYEALRSRALRV